MPFSLCDECSHYYASIFCTCTQLNLCFKCGLTHLEKSHILFENPLNFSTQIKVISQKMLDFDIKNLQCELLKSKIKNYSNKQKEEIKSKFLSNEKINQDIRFEIPSLIPNICIFDFSPDYNFILKFNLVTEEIVEKFRVDNSNKIIEPKILIFHDLLYLIGGFRRNIEFSNLIIEVNPEKYQMKKVGKIENNRYLFGSVIFEENIFIVGGSVFQGGMIQNTKTVQKFNVLTHKFDVLPDLNIPRVKPSLVVHQRQLYVFSEGQSNFERLSLERPHIFESVIVKDFYPLTDLGLLSYNDSKIIIFRHQFNGNDHIAELDENSKYKIIERLELKSDGWNSKLSPNVFGSNIYFFGQTEIMCFTESGDKQEIRFIPFKNYSQ